MINASKKMFIYLYDLYHPCSIKAVFNFNLFFIMYIKMKSLANIYKAISNMLLFTFNFLYFYFYIVEMKS